MANYQRNYRSGLPTAILVFIAVLASACGGTPDPVVASTDSTAPAIRLCFFAETDSNARPTSDDGCEFGWHSNPPSAGPIVQGYRYTTFPHNVQASATVDDVSGLAVVHAWLRATVDCGPIVGTREGRQYQTLWEVDPSETAVGADATVLRTFDTKASTDQVTDDTCPATLWDEFTWQVCVLAIDLHGNESTIHQVVRGDGDAVELPQTLRSCDFRLLRNRYSTGVVVLPDASAPGNDDGEVAVPDPPEGTISVVVVNADGELVISSDGSPDTDFLTPEDDLYYWHTFCVLTDEGAGCDTPDFLEHAGDTVALNGIALRWEIENTAFQEGDVPLWRVTEAPEGCWTPFRVEADGSIIYAVADHPPTAALGGKMIDTVSAEMVASCIGN